MLKKEIEIKKNISLNQEYKEIENYKISHDLIKKINYVKICGSLKYHDSIKILDVNCDVSVSFDAMDARSGELLKNNIENIVWEEQYSFEENVYSPDNNIVLGEEFDLLGYAIEQIVLNIPINFTKKYDTIEFVNEYGSYFDEDDYQSLKENKIDSRWEKLKDFNFNNENK